MNINNEPVNFSKYGKSFQEKLCMVILDDRPFADQIEEVLDVNFLELNYLKLFLNKIFDYRKKYGVHPSRDIMKTILRSELDNENELTAKQVREFYVRSQISPSTDIEYIKDIFYKSLIERGPFGSIPNLVKTIHFDQKHPENMTIKILNKKTPFINIYKGDKWQKEDKKTTIQRL